MPECVPLVIVADPLTVSVWPSAIVSVDPVAGAVNATLLIEVAVATPKTGVVSVGDVARTGFPVPVGVLFFNSFPVVPSNSAGTASVALAGPTTSPVPLADAAMVIESDPAFVVMVMFEPATNVSVSLVESATTLDWPLTAMVENRF